MSTSHDVIEIADIKRPELCSSARLGSSGEPSPANLAGGVPKKSFPSNFVCLFV
jgi:hypothetical protein